jgi:hypothetical protein
MKKNIFSIVKYIILTLIGVGIIYFYYKYPFKSETLRTIQNNLITASGILTGIVIAYLSAKQFQIRKNREDIQLKLNQLSDKLTNFRKILYRVMKSHDFWTEYADIDKFKRKYSGITFNDLHNQGENRNKLVSQFWLEESDISTTTADLYLAMEEITGPIEQADNWAYDKLHSYNYSLDYLLRCHMPANQIWYYLEGRFAKHTDGLINDKGIWVLFKDDVREFASQIDSKYKSVEIDRHALAQIGTEFHEIYFPRLIEMTKLIQKGLSKSMKTLLVTLTIILTSGVLIPLIMQTLDIPDCIGELLTFSMVFIVICGLISFMFDFYRMINRDIRLKE